MDFAAVTAAYEGIKSTKEVLAALIDAKIDSEAKTKIREAQDRLGQTQDVLFSLREELFRLQEDRTILKKQLEETYSWNKRLEQYALTQTVGGAVVYKFHAEPEHYACPSCINKKELHLLQDLRSISGKFRCPGCNSDYPILPQRPIDPIRFSGLP